MSRLFMTCALCGKRQAEGLLSRGAWGHFEVSEGHFLRACPRCKAQYVDWEQRVQASVAGDTPFGHRIGETLL
jgi:hypothetical protein